MKRYLILQDGTVFEGTAFGAEVADGALGELVFSTSVCGFNELLSSVKTSGQLLMQTFPSVGNCGFSDAEAELKCFPSGYIVHEWCDSPSAENAPHTLDEILKKNLIPGICNIDCRAITRIIREGGTQNALICDSIPNDISFIGEYTPKEPPLSVNKEPETHLPSENAVYSTVLLDLGCSEKIISGLLKRNCAVTVVSPLTKAEDIAAYSPDGIVIGDGAGDPSCSSFRFTTEQIALLKDRFPVLGFGIGHCLLASANGAVTEKLPHGHHGGQPVRDLCSGKTLVTDQYHMYAVKSDSIVNGKLRFVNSNDSTTEGIDYGKNGISAEFLSDDTFDAFVGLMSDRQKTIG